MARGGKNGYLQKRKHVVDRAVVQQRMFTMQQCKDMMLIAVHRAFGFGEERCKRLSEEYDEVFNHFLCLSVEDGRVDKDIIYTRAKVDEILKIACGKYFDDWDTRYKWTEE